MKRTAAIVALVLILGLGTLYVKNNFNLGTVSYERQVVEIEKVVEVDVLGKMIKDAQDQKASEIKQAGEEARLAAETRILEAIELEVREEYRKGLDAKELELKKKQTSY